MGRSGMLITSFSTGFGFGWGVTTGAGLGGWGGWGVLQAVKASAKPNKKYEQNAL